MATSTHRLAQAKRTLLTVSLCAALTTAWTHAHSEPANVISVSNCNDDGSGGTLRAAVEGASDGDTIDMTALQCSLITLQSGPILTTLPHLKLQGPGAAALTIDGNNADRVLKAKNLEISGVTVTHGFTSSALGGACVLAEGALALDDAVLADCVTVNANGGAIGGAASVFGSLTMHHSSVVASSVSSSDYAAGGGVFVSGEANVYNSLIGSNRAEAGQGFGYGGGLFANGSVTLHATVVENNVAQSSAYVAFGGGIHSNVGDIEILDGSTIANNSAHSDSSQAYGGGINDGTTNSGPATVRVRNSTITGNSASSACAACLVSGGGIHAFDSIDVAYSTFSYNEAKCDDTLSQCSTGGGGLAAFAQSPASAITLRNTTVSGNNSIGGTAVGAFAAGGGLFGGSGMRIVAHNSTIAFNHADTLGGGIAGTTSNGTPSELVSTIVASNHNSGGAEDIGAGPFSNELVFEGSKNLVNAAGPGVTLPADTSTDDPLLQPLTTDNGGATATHALALGSPAIDTGANPDALASDQRGFPHHRVAGVGADIGAYEFEADPSIFADDFEL